MKETPQFTSERNLNRANSLRKLLDLNREIHDPENKKLHEPGNIPGRFTLRLEIARLEGKSKNEALKSAIKDERDFITSLEEKFNYSPTPQRELSEGRATLTAIELQSEDPNLHTSLANSSSCFREAKRLMELSIKHKHLIDLSEEFTNKGNLFEFQFSLSNSQKPQHECQHNCKNHRPEIVKISK